MLLSSEQSNVNAPKRPPLSVLWIYACGQLGWSLAVYGVGSLMSYFYMPPEEAGAKAIFPNFRSLHRVEVGIAFSKKSCNGRSFLFENFTFSHIKNRRNKFGLFGGPHDFYFLPKGCFTVQKFKNLCWRISFVKSPENLTRWQAFLLQNIEKNTRIKQKSLLKPRHSDNWRTRFF